MNSVDAIWIGRDGGAQRCLVSGRAGQHEITLPKIRPFGKHACGQHRIGRSLSGPYTVVVTDCYRTSVPSPQKLADDDRFTPCRDAGVVIRNETLFVNGRSYGHLKSGDSILVDHGTVSLNQQVRDDGGNKL